MPTEEFVSYIDFGDGVVRTVKDPHASGNSVTGVKGDAEENYRTGNVNITKGNIGLGLVENARQLSVAANQSLEDTEKENARENLGLGSAATRNVPSTGNNANVTQVVLGSDTRLTNARPASDVYAWAKAENKPTYTASEVGAAASDHTHATALATDSGTSSIDLAANSVYKITAGGTSVIFKTPPDTNTTYSAGTGISFSGTTINNSGVRSVGTGGTNGTISVNTGGTAAEVAVKGLGSAAFTASTAYAAASHTHATSISTSSGTNQLTLAANTKYVITAGGTSYIFTTPPDTNTWRPIGTGATDAAAGNHTHSSVLDVGNSTATTFAYSKAGLNYADYTWLAAWNGYELRAVNKSQFAQASHTHNYAGSSSAGGAATSLANFENNNSTGKDANNVTYNAHTYYSSNGPATSIGASATDGALYSQAYNASWVAQIAQDYRNGNIFVRGKNNGTWQAWKKPDAGTLQGAAPAEAATGSTIVKRNSSGYIYATYYNQSSGAETPTTSSYMIYCNSDGWFRKSSLANVKTILGLGSAAYTASTAYAAASHTHNYAGSASAGGPANTVKGAYTANGGQQNPNYFGVNKVGFLMMNTTVNSNTHYKDWIIMDCYNGTDVGGGVAFGVNRQALGAYIMRSAAARTAWAESAELIGTHNYTTYCAKASHTHAYAPTSHASTATTYGVGNASNYGHVKLSDTYTSNVGAAANSIGASQNALFNAWTNCMKDGKAPGGQYFFLTKGGYKIMIGTYDFGSCDITITYGNSYFVSKSFTINATNTNVFTYTGIAHIFLSVISDGGVYVKVASISGTTVNCYLMDQCYTRQNVKVCYLAVLT